MKLRQGQFSFLPDLSDDDIRVQAQYAIDNGWAVSVEYSDDPHPRNTYWEMWGHPMFDNPDAAAVVFEVNECRKEHGGKYIRVIAFDASPGWESIRMSFIVNRPATEPGFRLVRQEAEGRVVRYTIESYATREPEGLRYA
ncbi:ribulose bisphosphate carboxylase small subunit [Paracoccus acridae]|uniref:Ribulose bisphosphate carboxylase small subunit n=2 Tax=Paracoccus TaxID=265 RepID=A0A0F6RA30_9RHOB|nr:MULTISPECIES: ribulose bisphosphate carboxylase small subunit [Paracoccus]AKE49381.1 ribulose-bisphosphate carboxylase small chain [Paracoccus sp. SY]GGF61256.1 ribulose bisphosphate carboxylase small subunit [Paracoccus acridae]